MPVTYRRSVAEILVNSVFTNNQNAPNVSVLNDGGFVVVWTDASAEGTDTSGAGVKAQRFDAAGAKVGGEFLVNSIVTNAQNAATVATLPSGRFVVTWNDASVTGGDVSGIAVRGQMFEADGTLVGGEFLVNTETTNSQQSSTVTELAGGGFVVAWQDASLIGGDASGNGIKAQLFDPAGAKVGGEILVNTVTTGGQNGPSIVALASGGFAVAWNGASSSSGSFAFGSIRLQLFDALGAKVGGEIEASGNSGFGQFTNAKVTVLPTGLVVTWSQSDTFPAGGSFDVKAQLFDTSGVKVGADFTVNTSTDGNQNIADVDPLPGGGFLVTWQGTGAGLSGLNVYGQVFDALGARVGVEFILSSVTDSNQLAPKVDVLASGDIVVVWSDSSAVGGDPSGSAIKAQILTISTDPPTDILLSGTTVSEAALEDVPLVMLETIGTLNSGYVYTILSDTSGGAFAIEGDALVVQDNSLLDFETAPQVEILIRATDENGNSHEETFQLDIADAPEPGYAPATAEFLVNVTTQANQSEPLITPLDTGGYLVLWREWIPFGGAGVGKGRLYDAAGHPVSGELALDGEAAAAVPGGGFILLRSESDGDGFGVVARFYDGAGAQVGGAIPVNTVTAGEQYSDSVAVLSSGGFVVSWTEYPGPSLGSDVKAQIFDAAGAKVGGELSVPTVVTGDQGISEVTALAGGGFVVSWSGEGAVRAQIYTAAGVRFGAPITVFADASVEGHVTALAGGGFVVTWAKNTSSGMFTGIANFSAQVFDADGVRVGDVILIDGGIARVISMDVGALPWGGFVATWAGYDDSMTNDPGIRAQVFDGTGARIGAEFMVSDPAFYEQYAADLGVLASGDFVLGWTDQLGGQGPFDSNFDTKTRLYSLASAGPTQGPDLLNGTPGDDFIDALGGDDRIHGLDGNDFINGGPGADTMTGGDGNDKYIVDNAGDVVAELAGGDTDSISTLVDHQLAPGSHVERLTSISWAQTTPLRLTGNEFANLIEGNAGDNFLDGRGGADRLVGFGGDDKYIVDNAGDVVVEASGAGTDVVAALVDYQLAAGSHVERLTSISWALTTPLKLTGNEFANLIEGNAGHNTLDGRGGADRLIGFGGDDKYVVDNAGDVVVEGSGGGNDSVSALVDYQLAAGSHVERLNAISFALTTPLKLTGNEIANRIEGNAGANQLDGKLGADTLVGFGGADTFAFTTALGGGVDAIGDFQAGIDKIALDDAIFNVLSPGPLPAGAFVTGSAAADAGDRIVYNSGTGQLFYDSDGNGAGAAVLFATLQTGLSLTAGDFEVI